jgi:hypothetical protein
MDKSKRYKKSIKSNKTNSFRKILKSKLNSQKSNNTSTTSIEFPVKSYFSPEYNPSSNTLSEKSPVDHLFFKANIHENIISIKDVYEELLDNLEKYIVKWKGSVKEKINDLINKIIYIQTEIRNQCKNYKPDDECARNIHNFITKINDYKKRIETIIRNIDNINIKSQKSPENIFMFKPKNMTKKQKKHNIKEIQKRKIILLLEYLLEEMNNYTKEFNK